MYLILLLALSCTDRGPLHASLPSSRAGTAGQVSQSKVQLVREGKTVALPHIKAVRFEPSEGPSRLHLLFSTAAPPSNILATSFGEDPASVRQWAVQREEIAVVVSTTESQEQNYLVTVLWSASAYVAGGTRADGKIKGAFRSLKVSRDRISGNVLIDEPGVLSGAFDVAIETIRETPFTSGPHVATSAQADVLMVYARAMSAMDMTAAQTFSASNVEQEFNEAKRELGANYVAQMIAERYGDPAQIEAALASGDALLREFGDTAQIRLKRTVKDTRGQETRTETFDFVRVNGVWKIK